MVEVESKRSRPRGILRVFIASSALFLFAAALAVVWFDRNILATLPSDLSHLRTWRPPTSCRVFDGAGSQIDEFYLERRVWVPINSLPQFVPLAFVAAEDHRFFEHPGVDLFGIVRALFVNLKSGTTRQGGSTITQQLIKNLLVGKERTYQRKLQEAALAWRLEQELAKTQLLELYINYVYLGSGNYGVEAAARDYFGVSASQLDPGQAALLAGLVPAPSKYSPRPHADLAAVRRTMVLHRMVEEGFLTPEERDAHLDDPVEPPARSGFAKGVGIAYVTQVRREVRRLLGNERPVVEGLHIHTPLDTKIQEVAERAVQDALLALDGRQGKRGPAYHLAPPAWPGFLARAPGMTRHPESGALLPPRPGQCFDALVGAPPDLDRLLAGTSTYALAAADRKAHFRRRAGPSAALGSGDVLRVCLTERGEVMLDPKPWAEGAALVLENTTGRVVALVGGAAVRLEDFVRATQARRQPGSSFKPYVYARALLDGKSPIGTIADAPLSLPGAGHERWEPKNYDGTYTGTVTLRHALARSLNTPAVRLLLDAGADEVAELARSMGVRTPLRRDPTLALGSSEVTLLDQVLGYATIARMGVPAVPVFVDRVKDSAGRELARAGEASASLGVVLPGGPTERALPPGVAYELADMLREVVRSGTARRAHKAGYDRAGKTGTTDDFVDAWFIGFTPTHTIGVWIGTDGHESLGDKETGGRAALPAWVAIAEALEHEGERLPIPDEAALLFVNGAWMGFRRGGAAARTLPEGAPIPPVAR